MAPGDKKFYEFHDISKYTFTQRIAIRLIGFSLHFFVSLIGKTLKFEVEGWETLTNIEVDGKKPIFAFWHDRIFLGAYYFRNRGIIVMSSESFDSEYTARFIQKFGFGIIKGSSTRGGVRALTEMIHTMKRGYEMGFTLDGPKGPRYEAKSGACVLAKKTGNPIVPFIIEAKGFRSLGTWDKLQIPRLFTKARILIGKPIYVLPTADDQEIENKRQEVQSALDELVKRGENWRDSENLKR